MRKNEPKANEYFSPKYHFPHSENINNVEKTEKINEEFENTNSTQIKTSLKDHLSENKNALDTNPPINENNNNVEKNEKINEERENSNSTPVKTEDESSSDNKSETNAQYTKSGDELLRNETENCVKTKETMNYENQSSNSTQLPSRDQIFRKNVPLKEKSLEKGSNENKKSSDSKNENLPYENKMYVNNKDDSTKNPLEERSFSNKYDDDDYDEDIEKNKSEMPNNWLSKYKVPSDNNNVKDNSNNNVKTSEDDLKLPENEKEVKISPEETSSKNENLRNSLNQNTLDHKFADDENNSLNQSTEVKPLVKNNNLSDKYPSNEDYKANNSIFNELNNPGKNVKSSDIGNKLKPNSSQNSVIENKHLKTMNFTTNVIKPSINLNSTTPQNNNQEEIFSEKNTANSNHTKNQLENGDKISTNNNDKTIENKIDYLQENGSKSYDQSTVKAKIITTGSTVESPNNSQQMTSNNYYPNQPYETNDKSTETPAVDEPATNKIDNKNQINNFSENTENAKPIEPSIKQNSHNLNFSEQNTEKVPISNNASATDSVQNENSFTFASIYSKLFPNGIQLSKATIFGGL